MNTGSQAVDAYIETFDDAVQAELRQIRQTIADAAPGTDEAISYGVPARKFNGKAFIFFAGYAKFFSVYPAPRDAPEFVEELAGYKGGKGTVQFPIGQPVPYDLIARITRFRLDQVQESAR